MPLSFFDYNVFYIVNNSGDTVSFAPLKPYYVAGDSFVVNCSINLYQLLPVIITNVTFYLKQNNTIVNSNIFSIKNNGYNKFSLAVPFTNVNLSDAGNYICFYSLSGSSFFRLSDFKYNATNVIVKS